MFTKNNNDINMEVLFKSNLGVLDRHSIGALILRI